MQGRPSQPIPPYQQQTPPPASYFREQEPSKRGSIWAVLGPILAILVIGFGLLIVPWDDLKKKPKAEPETEVVLQDRALEMLNKSLQMREGELKEELSRGDAADPDRVKELEEAIEEIKKKLSEND